MLVRSRRGVGANEMFPGWCSWMPGADFFSACQVPLADVLRAQQQADLSKVAAVNPELAAAGVKAGDAAAFAYCQQNPEACAEFTFAGENPTLAAILGAGPAARKVAGLPDDLTNTVDKYGNWIMLGAIAIGVIFLAKVVR